MKSATPRETVLLPDTGPSGSVRVLRSAEPEARGQLIPDFDIPPPPALDGWAFALLPLAMRMGGRLRVEGRLTRNALRNLAEIAEAWTSWDHRAFPPLIVEAAEVVDGTPPATDPSALVAWSGSLRSTHVLLRQWQDGQALARPVRGVVRVWGLRREEIGQDPGPALEPARQALAQWGLPLHVVQLSAFAGVDRDFGALPWAVAALHRLSARAPLGWCARSSSWTAHIFFPRPGPVLPDLWSGDHMEVRYDAGATSPARMVKELAAHPALLALVSNCLRRPRHARPCGGCPGCRSLRLARSAAGLDAAPNRMALATWPMRGPSETDDVHAAARDWSTPGDPAHRNLLARIALNQRMRRWRSTAQWIGSAAGWSPSWPR